MPNQSPPFMKAKNYLLLICLLLASHLLRANASGISINNVARELVAPRAPRYQWYKDGIRLPMATSQRLKVTESGAYALETTTAQGQPHTEQISVLVSATGAIVRLYTIGDSTVQTYTAGYYPRTGWGQVLQSFFQTSGVVVDNKAVGGTSSKSFYKLYWPAVRNALVAGDYVFIQFGINDRTSTDTARYAPTGGIFEGYLTRYVNEARARGAIPVLVTTIRRNAWTNDSVVYDAYHDHPVAVRTVANSLNVPLVDLDARAKVLLQSVRQVYSTSFWYNNYLPGEYPNYPTGNVDDVHFQEMGAIEMAKLVVDGLQALSGDARVSGLLPSLYPRHQVSTSANIPAAGRITRTALYPPGVTITLKGVPTTGHRFTRWADAVGATVATTPRYSFIMTNVAASYRAYFDANAALATALPTDLTGVAASVAPTPFTSETGIAMPGKFHYKIIAYNGMLVERGEGTDHARIGKNLGSGLFIVLLNGENTPPLSYKIVKQ